MTKDGWKKSGNISIYVGQHTSFWFKKSSHYILGKHRGSAHKFRQPVDYVIAVSGEKGTSTEVGYYNISWFMGFTHSPNPLFAVTPAFNVSVAGKEHNLRPRFEGRLADVEKVRAMIARMIDTTDRLPTEKEVINRMYRELKNDRSYTISNWFYYRKQKKVTL